MTNARVKRIAIGFVTVVLFVAVAAGVSTADPGKGKGNGNGNGNGVANGHNKQPAAPSTPTTTAPSSPAAAQYGPAGKQYGRHKVAVCHKHHTIFVAQPAVKAHLRHGDTLGRC